MVSEDVNLKRSTHGTETKHESHKLLSIIDWFLFRDI